MPHVPQLSGSDARSVHWPPQAAGVVPFVQAQALDTQTSPPVHALPQLPQSWELVVGSTQAPLQSVSPVAQVAVHAPCEQTCDVPQATPHPPQLLGSDVVSTHRPAQSRPVAQPPSIPPSSCPLSTLESFTVASVVPPSGAAPSVLAPSTAPSTPMPPSPASVE
jgi:hypothetical protein